MSVKIELYDNLYLRFITNNLEYLRALKEHFTEKASNYYFSPLARSGIWDGSISFFNGRNRTLPYGVLDEVIEWHKFEYPDVELKIDSKVKDFFKPPKINISFDLNLHPHSYQEDVIRKLLRYSKGIARVATAGGKSLIIAYIIDILRKNNLSERALIIVPTIILLNQFKTDLVDYGMDENLIGLVGDKYKEFDKPITIATWQSLQVGKKIKTERKQSIKKNLKLYDTAIVDETHLAQSHELKNILSECISAKFRFGLTGTLHDERLDLLNTKSFLGPIIVEYSSSELADEGYISKCNVLVLNMHYDEDYKGDYAELKDKVFNDKFRLETIEYLINNIKDNFLLLVGLVEKEGELLKNYLQNRFPKKKIVFISGKTPSGERQEWRQKMNKEKNVILIATYALFQCGVNIPSLKFLILASPFKSKIRILQSIGRTLRQHSTKLHGAYIIDLSDQVRSLTRHGELRMRFYTREGFNIKEYFVYQDDINDLQKITDEIG